MKIRLGYVAMTIDLKDCSPSKTITYSKYEKIEDEEVKLYKLKKLTEENLKNTKRILLYNKAHDIQVYRLTSKLVPLATHPHVLDWDYKNEFKELYREIETIIKENNMRISAHPDHFTIISSPKSDVVEASIKDLVYHNNIMEGFGLNDKNGKLVIHIGGKYDSKEKTKERFMKIFLTLPEKIQNRLIIENDDKIYDTIDVLEICESLNIPMVLDIHHQWCNNRNENIEEYLERIFNTWNNQSQVPKIHISSPKSEKNIRAHAENVDFNFFYKFIKKAKKLDRDFDVVIEAKNKNIALFNLMKDIKKSREFNIVNGAKIEI